MAFAAPHSTALLAAVARATQPSRAGPAGRPCARHWAVGRQAAAPRRALVPVRATDSPSSTEVKGRWHYSETAGKHWRAGCRGSFSELPLSYQPSPRLPPTQAATGAGGPAS